ncbi:MAG: tetratricopeptide repeat protein [Oligoflexia bacterium]|nr:tetratricopeptide repeat protein [Oligoflexia bacterium]
MLAKVKKHRALIAGLGVIIALAVVLFLPKISLEKRLLSSAKNFQKNRHWQEAAEEYERAVKYAPDSPTGIEAARLGAGVCLYDLKNYEKAVFFFRHLVLHSQKSTEIKWAQQKLAEVFYEKINNYTQAIIEYQRLLQAAPSKEEAADYRLRLGRSYYYLANFDQAISEVNEFLNNNPQDPKVFEMMMLKADSYLALKKIDDAVAIYDQIEKQFASNEELFRVKLNKSLAYEDKKDWDNAVQELEEIKNTYPHPDVIELKIKSILRRKARKRE